ncbi:MAG TPA: molybdenum cofactor biosynthesis protein MoaE [Candidatus Nanopelagicaceae bacterium]
MSDQRTFQVEIVTSLVTVDPIHVEVLSRDVQSESCGAIVTFCGDVRDNDHGKKVASLKYEVHPSAQEILMQVVRKVANRHDVVKVAVAHRYGEIPIGESAFIVAVSAVHRIAAFEACSELVDEVKAQIPIWKYQVFTDGTNEWVHSA